MKGAWFDKRLNRDYELAFKYAAAFLHSYLDRYVQAACSPAKGAALAFEVKARAPQLYKAIGGVDGVKGRIKPWNRLFEDKDEQMAELRATVGVWYTLELV